MRWPVTKKEKIAVFSNHCIRVADALMETASAALKSESYGIWDLWNACAAQIQLAVLNKSEDVWVVELNVELRFVILPKDQVKFSHLD